MMEETKPNLPEETLQENQEEFVQSDRTEELILQIIDDHTAHDSFTRRNDTFLHTDSRITLPDTSYSTKLSNVFSSSSSSISSDRISSFPLNAPGSNKYTNISSDSTMNILSDSAMNLPYKLPDNLVKQLPKLSSYWYTKLHYFRSIDPVEIEEIEPGTRTGKLSPHPTIRTVYRSYRVNFMKYLRNEQNNCVTEITKVPSYRQNFSSVFEQMIVTMAALIENYATAPEDTLIPEIILDDNDKVLVTYCYGNYKGRTFTFTVAPSGHYIPVFHDWRGDRYGVFSTMALAMSQRIHHMDNELATAIRIHIATDLTLIFPYQLPKLYILDRIKGGGRIAETKRQMLLDQFRIHAGSHRSNKEEEEKEVMEDDTEEDEASNIGIRSRSVVHPEPVKGFFRRSPSLPSQGIPHDRPTDGYYTMDHHDTRNNEYRDNGTTTTTSNSHSTTVPTTGKEEKVPYISLDRPLLSAVSPGITHSGTTIPITTDPSQAIPFFKNVPGVDPAHLSLASVQLRGMLITWNEIERETRMNAMDNANP